MTLPRLPVTVISGYLGAGKTTLINRLLAENHGLSLMIMVNDFGAINIDAALIRKADGDTIELTNGCVCCTMGADLFMAMADALDRRPRPDHLVIEASGIADPARIANAALAEPDLEYGGIVTVIEARMFSELANDPQIGAQFCQQISAGDLIVMRDEAGDPAGWLSDIRALTDGHIVSDDLPDLLAPLLLEINDVHAPATAPATHPGYTHWQTMKDGPADRQQLQGAIDARPPGVLRLKGFVRTTDGQSWEVHAVGSRFAVTAAAEPVETRLVALGLQCELNVADLDRWWSRSVSNQYQPACRD